MSENLDILKSVVGQKLVKVEDTDTGVWHSSQGAILVFENGTRIELDADMGQGTGYLIVSHAEPEGER